jgi:two-component system, LytTR family, sensor kinase
MKRVLLHVAFWVAYVVQDVLLIFLVNTTRVQQTTGRNLVLSGEQALILLIPKLLFTYFILSITLNRIIKEGFGKKWSLYSLVALVLSILLYRALLVFCIDPLIYGWHDEGASFFYALGFPVALMDIGFVSGAAIAIKQIRQQLMRSKMEQSLIKEKLETELKYLRNQTNPHFLFNTLNNIYALARKKSSDTPDAIMKLSKLLRFMLYDTAKPLISIGDEIRLLEDYIDLEKMRYNSKLTITFLKDINNEQEQISPLLLLPFVENAFKHGASESRFASFIHLEVKLQEGILTFSIKNTKENNSQECKDTNIGLNNVKRQLELLYTEYDMRVVNEMSVYIVLLTINLRSYAKNKMSYS